MMCSQCILVMLIQVTGDDEDDEEEDEDEDEDEDDGSLGFHYLTGT